MKKELDSIPEDFSPNSSVWIYQSDRTLTDNEIRQIRRLLHEFTDRWTAHNLDLKAWGEVFFHRFIVLAVDNSVAPASGCSIDKSVHFLKELENHFGIHLFDRLYLPYINDGAIVSIHKSDLRSAFDQGTITGETLVFDHTVQNLKDLKENWIRPLKDSWAGYQLLAH